MRSRLRDAGPPSRLRPFVCSAFAAAVLIGTPAGATVGSRANATTPTCRPSTLRVCVDRADSGRHVRLRIGQTVEVALSAAGLSWSAISEQGARVLAETAPTRATRTTVTAAFRAIARGSTTLAATGRPVCRTGPACPQYVLLWRVELVVS